MFTNGRTDTVPHLWWHAAAAGVALVLFAAGCGGSSTRTAGGTAKRAPIKSTVASTTTTTSTTVPQPTTTTTAAPNTLPLAKVVVPAPTGFRLSHQVAATNGPLTPAKFNQVMNSPNEASNDHFLDGYDITYDSVAGSDSVDVMVVDLATVDDTASFVSGFSPSNTTVAVNDPAIAGGYDFNSTKANPDGGFDHGVIAAKGTRVMIIDDLTGSANPVPLVSTMAQQQYANL